MSHFFGLFRRPEKSPSALCGNAQQRRVRGRVTLLLHHLHTLYYAERAIGVDRGLKTPIRSSKQTSSLGIGGLPFKRPPGERQASLTGTADAVRPKQEGADWPT